LRREEGRVENGGWPPPIVKSAMGWYSLSVDIAIRFSQSAFKHGITEADIRMAFDTARYDEILDEYDEGEDLDGKYLLIGFDRKANLLEILYNIIDENTVNVFHAMKCRNIFLPLLPD
jgi:hypothetical protein